MWKPGGWWPEVVRLGWKAALLWVGFASVLVTLIGAALGWGGVDVSPDRVLLALAAGAVLAAVGALGFAHSHWKEWQREKRAREAAEEDLRTLRGGDPIIDPRLRLEVVRPLENGGVEAVLWLRESQLAPLTLLLYLSDSASGGLAALRTGDGREDRNRWEQRTETSGYLRLGLTSLTAESYIFTKIHAIDPRRPLRVLEVRVVPHGHGIQGDDALPMT